MELKAVALHLIRKGTKSESVQPLLSEAISPISPTIRKFLEDSFLRFLPRSRRIVRGSETSIETPNEISSYFNGQLDLLSLSVSLATRLQSLQSGSYSDGLLLVAKGDFEGRSSLFIVKLEHEQGIRAKQSTDDHGRLIFDVEYLKDLFMTKNTQVYKVAIFDNRCADESSFEGRLVDRQVQGYNVAAYFLFDFLGCEYALRADVLTQSFHDAVQDVIRNMPEAADKAKLQVALMSELRSNDKSIDTSSFAKRHLPIGSRQEFLENLSARSVPMTWTKDTRLVENTLRDVQVVFQSGSILITPPAELDESGSVTVAKDQEGERSRVTIVDTVVAVNGKGRASANTASEGATEIAPGGTEDAA